MKAERRIKAVSVQAHRHARGAWALLFGATLLTLSGCTHVQLQHNTVRQAFTLEEIHQQQVMNNLAMFVYDRNSLPSFAIPNQGSSAVTDAGSCGSTQGFARSSSGGPFKFNSLGFSFNAQRQAQEAFTLTPVNDPRKLELMRCAYQQAVHNCCGGEISEHCPDCKTIQSKFYTGDPDGEINKGGVVTSQCLKGPCWFHVGCKKCVPKKCACTFVGCYCGTYVWVLPDGQNELTKLTLAILDYALHDAPQLRTKQVVYYIDEYGLPTTHNRAVGQVTAAINIDEQDASLLNVGALDEARLEQVIKARRMQVANRLSQLRDKESSDERKQLLAEQESLDAKLQYINEQFRVGGLKQQYYPPANSSAPGSLLLPFSQQYNALTPQPLQPQ